MKKNTFLLFLFFVTHVAFSQSKVGVVGGLNFSDLKTATSTKTRTFIGVGGLFEYAFNDNFSIQTEPMFLMKGAKNIEGGGDPDIIGKLSFIEVPIFLKYTFGETIKPYFIAGPSFGFLLSSNLEAEMGGVKIESNIKENTQKLDLGLGLGAGFEIPLNVLSVFVEGRYTVGLVNLQKGGKFEVKGGGMTFTDTFDKEEHRFKTRGIQIFVGMKLPI